MGADAASGRAALSRRVLVLADDLIWSTRLAGLLEDAGAEAVVCRTEVSFDAALPTAAGAIVDLTARAYEPLTAVRRAVAAGVRVLCVGQHDDSASRRAALDAGASKVYPYRKIADDGPGALRAWLEDPVGAAASGFARGSVFGPRAEVAAAVSGIPRIPVDRYGERLDRVRELLVERELDAFLAGVGPDLVYLTGYDATPLERLTMLVVRAGGSLTLLAPRLELTPATACPAAAGGLLDVLGWEETDDAHALVARLVDGRLATDPRPSIDASNGRPVRPARVAVSDRVWASHLLRLQAALPGAEWYPGSSILGRVRIVKDADEIELLRRAAAAADRVVDAIAAGRLVGRTEADVSREVRERLLAEGHTLAEFAIVASGPNSASPHHEAGERRIGAGEPIVLDIGGIYGGYASDTTRTLWVTGGDPSHGPDDEFLRLFGVLRAAQAEASHAVRPGVPAERIDAVAREIVSAGGYGPRFIHRTGHGIGLETHEEPYLVAGNGEALREGMAFSVEPGIYLEGRYGARIEDIVICGADGPDVLNRSSRELRVVDGT